MNFKQYLTEDKDILKKIKGNFLVYIPIGETEEIKIPFEYNKIYNIYPDTVVRVIGTLNGVEESIRTTLENVIEKINIYRKHNVTDIKIVKI